MEAKNKQSAVMQMCIRDRRITDGICAETPEACIKNIARVGNPGMLQTDKVIMHIMLSKGVTNIREDNM